MDDVCTWKVLSVKGSARNKGELDLVMASPPRAFFFQIFETFISIAIFWLSDF